MNPYNDPNGNSFGPDEDFDADMITMNPPRWQRWRPARPVAITGVAIVALAGGAGVGYVATHSTGKPATDTSAVSTGTTPTPTPSTLVPLPGSRVGPVWRGLGAGFPFFAGPLGLGGADGTVHGELTVPKPGGGYQTLDVQDGTVTAVSAASVTVKSADGYSLTYTVTSKTLVDAQAAGVGSVKKGDSVFITATVSGSTPTAADIYDLTAVKAGRASFGFPVTAPMNPAKAMPTQPPTESAMYP
jgi:hypothetical protein